MKVGHFGLTFIFPGKTVKFFGVKFFVTSFILKVRKSKKNQHVWMHTYMCIRENVTGGAHCAPPALNRVNIGNIVSTIKTFQRSPGDLWFFEILELFEIAKYRRSKMYCFYGYM